MRLEPVPRPTHTVRVSARLITSSAILHLSSDELERTVNQEQTENPALEVVEHLVCLFCGTPLYGHLCPACGHLPTQSNVTTDELVDDHDESQDSSWYTQQTFYDIDNYSFVEADSDSELDPFAALPTGEPLGEVLLQHLQALIPEEDAQIAEQLVGNLNEHGYLEASVHEIADYLDLVPARVEYVLDQLQMLEPTGIGARNLRECLLIQLEALREVESPHPLIETLIDRYLDRLGRNQFHDLARELHVPEQEVRRAALYIRRKLHPYPALMYRTQTPSGSLLSEATYIHPDVVIRKGAIGFEVELVEEKRYSFHTVADHAAPYSIEKVNHEVQSYIHHHHDRAKFFVDCVQRRWRTLKRIAELVVDYQCEFLQQGIRYLRPLTRAEVASRLNLDEGTVSRATANKYALLPNGQLMSLSDFFDCSLGVKDVLRELIYHEQPNHRLSDEELAHLLHGRGIAIARRTVMKYREEMRVPSSRER